MEAMEGAGDGIEPPAAPPNGLNPAQAEVLRALGAKPEERPAFDDRLRHELRAELEADLAAVAGRLPEAETLFVNKHALSSVHGCEAMYVAREAEEFAWTPANARGTVAHKAIELSVSWRGDPAPAVLVDEAIGRLIESDSNISAYLGALGEAERAELHSEATERVSMFEECFPPLLPRWKPVPESRLRADLCEDRIVLSGKVDLTVGQADGNRAGKVLIDMKTGAFSPTHTEDLRFYALVETLRLGTPPRLLATYYLDSGRLQQEKVTVDLLRGAVRRVVDGATSAVALLHEGRDPVYRPGPPCRWCPIQADCEPGRAWLTQRDEQDGW